MKTQIYTAQKNGVILNAIFYSLYDEKHQSTKYIDIEIASQTSDGENILKLLKVPIEGVNGRAMSRKEMQLLCDQFLEQFFVRPISIGYDILHFKPSRHRLLSDVLRNASTRNKGGYDNEDNSFIDDFFEKALEKSFGNCRDSEGEQYESL